uniref:Uncharacterized protein n=1 Tax=viral metagenome TaxID=1070528 RepID=A0A6C0BZK6_9ZZZZ
MKPSKYKHPPWLNASKRQPTEAAVSPWVEVESRKWLLTRDVDDNHSLPCQASVRTWIDLGGFTIRSNQGLHFHCDMAPPQHRETRWLRIENGCVQLDHESAAVSIRSYAHVELHNVVVKNIADVVTSMYTPPVLSFDACAFAQLTSVSVRRASAVRTRNYCLVEVSGGCQGLVRKGGVSIYDCTFSAAQQASLEIVGLGLARLRCVRICRLTLEHLHGTRVTGIKLSACSNCIVDLVALLHSRALCVLQGLRFESQCLHCALFENQVDLSSCSGESSACVCSPRSQVYDSSTTVLDSERQCL